MTTGLVDPKPRRSGVLLAQRVFSVLGLALIIIPSPSEASLVTAAHHCNESSYRIMDWPEIILDALSNSSDSVTAIVSIIPPSLLHRKSSYRDPSSATIR